MVSVLLCLLPTLFMSAFTAALFVAGKADFEKKNSPTMSAIKAASMILIPALYTLVLWFQLGSVVVTAFMEQTNVTKRNSTSQVSSPTEAWGEDDTTDEVVGSLSRTVYWVANGKSYHFSRSCPSLSRSTDIISGTLREARANGYCDPCNNCVE